MNEDYQVQILFFLQRDCDNLILSPKNMLFTIAKMFLYIIFQIPRPSVHHDASPLQHQHQYSHRSLFALHQHPQPLRLLHRKFPQSL